MNTEFYSNISCLEELEMKRTLANETGKAFLENCIQIENYWCFPIETDVVWFNDSGKLIPVDDVRITTIPERCFYGNSQLKSIKIPNGVTSIGDYAFEYCSELTSVIIPSSVTSIGYETFHGCSGLTSVSIPESVTSIGDWAFGGCSELALVTIPNSITSIGVWSFYGCDNLKLKFKNRSLKQVKQLRNYPFGLHEDQIEI